MATASGEVSSTFPGNAVLTPSVGRGKVLPPIGGEAAATEGEETSFTGKKDFIRI